jgi:hypothetical protein
VGDAGGAVSADATVQGAGRRVCQRTEERRHEEEGAPGQLAQVHGHLSQTANVLLALRGFHLVSRYTAAASIKTHGKGVGICKDLFRPCKDLLRRCKDLLRPCKELLRQCKDLLRSCKDLLRPCKDLLRPCKDLLSRCSGQFI